MLFRSLYPAESNFLSSLAQGCHLTPHTPSPGRATSRSWRWAQRGDATSPSHTASQRQDQAWTQSQLLASPGVSARVSRAKPGVPCCPPPTSACPADVRALEAQLSSCCPGMPGSRRPSQGARTQAGRGEYRASRRTPLPPPQLAPSLAERAEQRAGLGQVSWKTGKGKGTPGLPGAWAAGCPASGGAQGQLGRGSSGPGGWV